MNPGQNVDLQRRGVNEHLGARSTVHMHFLIATPIDLDVDHLGREGAGNRRRGDENLPDEMKRTWPFACSELGDIPDHRPAFVEVRGPNQQDTALLVRICRASSVSAAIILR